MRVHFISIGGAAMHNMALALHQKGYHVTGSDDQIFEPSKSRLAKAGLLPEKEGWDESRITEDLDAVLLGMHAREDNPELKRAQALGLPIYSYPEYIYKQSQNKRRIVIGGSHGKTTITSMVMYVLKAAGVNFDYMVGAQIEGFNTMVKLTEDAPIIVLEGDEYLSSPIDKRPKFHWYKPEIALLSGIAWDHINVFPTWENYVEQFKIFIDSIEEGGHLIYFKGDETLKQLANQNERVNHHPYTTPSYTVKNEQTFLQKPDEEIPLQLFGAHNLQNMMGAEIICKLIGLSENQFYEHIRSFTGASKRLEKIHETETSVAYKDFAHSPSKLKATVKAVKNQYQEKELIAVVELHTFSSLNKKFIGEYKHTMQAADRAYVYYNPETVKRKKLDPISKEELFAAFDQEGLTVSTNSKALFEHLSTLNYSEKVLLLMTSGNFDGFDLNNKAMELLS